MRRLVSSVQEVNGLIKDIASSTTHQSEGISQVNAAVGQLDQMTQQNAAMVEESAAASEGLRHQANELTHLISQFVFRCGITLALPIFPLYWVRELHASDAWIGLINTVNSGVSPIINPISVAPMVCAA